MCRSSPSFCRLAQVASTPLPQFACPSSLLAPLAAPRTRPPHPLLLTRSARPARRLGELATNKKDYPTFLRAIAGHEATFVPAFMSIFKHFDWKRIGVVSEKSAVPRGIHDALSADAQLKGVDLAVEARKVYDCTPRAQPCLPQYTALRGPTTRVKCLVSNVCTHYKLARVHSFSSLPSLTRHHLLIPCRLAPLVRRAASSSLASPSSITPLERRPHRRRAGGGRKAYQEQSVRHCAAGIRPDGPSRDLRSAAHWSSLWSTARVGADGSQPRRVVES